MRNREEMIVEILRLLETAEERAVRFVYFFLLQFPRE